jgi:hypothetical protein
VVAAANLADRAAGGDAETAGKEMIGVDVPSELLHGGTGVL